jgi:hypothetical protein
MVRKITATVNIAPLAAPAVFHPYKRGTHDAGSLASSVRTREAIGSDMPMKNVGHKVTRKMTSGSATRGRSRGPSHPYSTS